MDIENKYLVTLLANNSDEAYLTAVLENTEDGRNLISIIQNSNVSSEVNVADIELGIIVEEKKTKIRTRTVRKNEAKNIDELPDLTTFLETNVLVVPAKRRPTDSDIIMRLDL